MSLAVDADAPAAADTRWVMIRRATQRLGVNESTVRRWADAGKVRSFRTPGRHRRIAEQDLYAIAGQQPSEPKPEDGEGAAVEEVRRQVRRSRTRGGWLSSLSSSQRQAYRPLGHCLVGLAVDYVSGREPRPDIEHTVDEISRRCGELLAQHGAGLSDAIEAFILFRDASIAAVQQVVARHLLGPAELASAREQIALLLDRVLIQIAWAFASPENAGAAEATRRPAVAPR